MHRDKHGLIVQADGDGGDTCQRTGMWWFGQYLRDGKWLKETSDAFLKEARQLEVADGILVRHPHQQDYRPPSRPIELPIETFRSDPASTSRDQQDPLVVALGVLEPGKQPLLNRIWRAHSGRFFKYQNADVANPQTFGVWIRAFRAWWLWPLLLLTDLGLLFNAFVARFNYNPDDTDDLNHIIRLLQAWLILPTPVSWLARKLYARWRQKSYGSYVGEYHENGVTHKYPGESHYVYGALVWYFRPQNKGNPEFAELYKPLIAELF